MIFQIIVVILLVMNLLVLNWIGTDINKVHEYLKIHDAITMDENEQKRMGNLYKELHK